MSLSTLVLNYLGHYNDRFFSFQFSMCLLEHCSIFHSVKDKKVAVRLFIEPHVCRIFTLWFETNLNGWNTAYTHQNLANIIFYYTIDKKGVSCRKQGVWWTLYNRASFHMFLVLLYVIYCSTLAHKAKFLWIKCHFIQSMSKEYSDIWGGGASAESKISRSSLFQW